MRLRVKEIWKLTKKGKIVARPDRECSKCYEVGEIVGASPFNSAREKRNTLLSVSFLGLLGLLNILP